MAPDKLRMYLPIPANGKMQDDFFDMEKDIEKARQRHEFLKQKEKSAWKRPGNQ